ncbi:HAD family hydrolase [Streptomyces sp. NPDC087440]|uniref:HAD family hydrolase n=1 Tax=Streptomyces sp. NPDC087440 TaxID=3365790 RepID=UPI0038245384
MEPSEAAEPSGLRFAAVLLDFDGVLNLWDPDGMSALDRARGLPEGTLARAAFEAELLEAAVTGRLTDEEWRARVALALTPTCGSADRARALVAAWSGLSGRIDTELLDLVAALRAAGVPVALVSNATTRLESYLEAKGLAASFDAVLNTSRLGIAKPDPRVYAEAARLVATPPDRCLFVDDTRANVTAAREAGLTGHHYRGVPELRSLVAPLLG